MAGESTIEVVYDNLPKLSDLVRQSVAKIVAGTAEALANDAKASMAEPKHGQLYRVGVISRLHSQPSVRGY